MYFKNAIDKLQLRITNLNGWQRIWFVIVTIYSLFWLWFMEGYNLFFEFSILCIFLSFAYQCYIKPDQYKIILHIFSSFNSKLDNWGRFFILVVALAIISWVLQSIDFISGWVIFPVSLYFLGWSFGWIWSGFKKRI